MSGDVLVVLYEEHEVARIHRDHDRLRLMYDPRWRADARFPISVSMPLASAEHHHEPVEAFIDNLLPDNDAVRERWGQRFQVSPRNPFKLIEHVGEECAGAFSFVGPARVAALTTSSRAKVRWLSEDDVADRLRALRDDASAWRLPSDTGQFSLAGAQPKIALIERRGRWGVPTSGATPTTHILKPPMQGLHGQVENEHFCLSLARELGLPVASSRIGRFGDELAIIVERYDRAAIGTRIVRLHQEDLCQALAVRPMRKYQNDGGPTPRDIARVLRGHSSRPAEDVATFRDALVLSWLIAGTDAHAKNYSILHGVHGHVRLAPLYDIASALPYFASERRRLKLAMKIGRHYRLDDIGWRDFELLADELGLSRDETSSRVIELATRLPEAAASVRARMTSEGLARGLDVLESALRARSADCLARARRR